MDSDVLWGHVVRVVRGLQQPSYEPPLRGRFTIKTSADLESINACVEAEEDVHLVVHEPTEQAELSVGMSVVVSLAPRFGFGLVVKNLDGLLAAQGCRIKEPRRYLLLDQQTASNELVEEGSLISRYRLTLALVQSLRASAAFLDVDEQALIFFEDSRFDVPVSYSATDVESLAIEAARSVTSALPQGMHEKQCSAIMAAAVLELTRHLPPERRMAYLLGHAAELRKRYDDGYRLFASGFSYERVRDQVEAARVEYAGKIHKAFSDIQNQLLGIPVATIVVATQMKDAKAIGYEFWVNTAVLVGCWVFAVLMVFLLRNQGHTLNVLQDEIERQKRQLEKDFAPVAVNFVDTFQYLQQRAATQRKVLWAIDGLVLIGLLLSHIVYFKLTPAAWDKVLAAFQ